MNEDANKGGVGKAALLIGVGYGAKAGVHLGMTSEAAVKYMDEQYMSKKPDLLARGISAYHDHIAPGVRSPMAAYEGYKEYKSNKTAANGERDLLEISDVMSKHHNEAIQAYKEGAGKRAEVFEKSALNLEKELGGKEGAVAARVFRKMTGAARRL